MVLSPSLKQSERMQPVIYTDLRCLQDRRYRVRGIGQHVSALLRTRAKGPLSSWRTIGLVDPEAEKLPDDCASWVDEVSCSANPCCGTEPAIFLDGTPMTHDMRFGTRFQSNYGFFSAAVVYDFIPYEWPGYLPTVTSRIEYLAKLARLRKFNFFAPISEYSAWRLTDLLGAAPEHITVTGASVRQSVYDLSQRLTFVKSPYDTQDPYFLIVVAVDSRKNAEVAVKAMRHLNLLYGTRIALKVVGHYPEFYKQDLLRLAEHAERGGFLEFCPDVSDHELVSLLAGALATIVPSHIEGFSLPVVEASVCRCPAIVSTCAAHLELVDREEALFPSYSADVLSNKLEAIYNNPALREDLVQSQAHLGPKFHESKVGACFWNALHDAIRQKFPPSSIRRKKKPRIAFLSPYPPDHSGVARFMALAVQASEAIFQADVYSDASRPFTAEGAFRDAGRVSKAPLIGGQYDAVVSVLGNSHFHSSIFDVFERYGGPCILHDARLIQIYIHRMGHDRFLALAARHLGRPVDMQEVHQWLHDRQPGSLFLEPVIERAAPLMVHTATQRAQIKAMYGADAEVITCCPTVFFSDEELTAERRSSTRDRYGVPAEAFLLSSFGIVGTEKGLNTCILATDLLRSWNIPAELYFVGNAGEHKAEIERLAWLYGIAGHVHVDLGFVEDQKYRDFLTASDAAVQLRTYGFGQFSAALADCVSAGLPGVATRDLALSCDAPEYIATVPDQFSPLQLAEELATICESRSARHSITETRADYLRTHNFKQYGRRLVEILGLA